MTKDLFIITEIKKIEIDKWIEGMKTSADPGNEFVLDWIERNAQCFRRAWDISKCKDCTQCEDCGYNLLSACNNFIEN